MNTGIWAYPLDLIVLVVFAVLGSGSTTPVINPPKSVCPNGIVDMVNFTTGPHVIVVFFLNVADMANAVFVKVWMACFHGIECGQHSMQLLDTMCALTSVLGTEKTAMWGQGGVFFNAKMCDCLNIDDVTVLISMM